MEIRRLRLSGFKSFVEPAELRVEPGLTGVVGPNGCGKSNLLEAIRWVMGETSAKSMRSGGMEDVIFAGTEQRPPRQFAEVVLTGTDDRGEELEVVRRIERGAGSAYRINGRDVRAKDVALLFADAGAEHLHVVDLDGAFAGESRNREAVERIVEAFPGHVQLGGGIRKPSDVEGWFALGVSRLVIGSAALKDPQFVKDMARAHAGRIVVAVDARDGMVATDGWAEVSDVSIVDMARRFEDAGVASLLFTDIGRDGLLKGVNIDATVGLARQVDIPVIASGGVKGLIDIDTLMQFAADGIEGVITGRALYDGRLDLAAALAMAARQ